MLVIREAYIAGEHLSTTQTKSTFMGDTKVGKNEAFLFGTLPSYSNHWPNGKEINRSKLANNMQPTS